jgi:hypothetical protein
MITTRYTTFAKDVHDRLEAAKVTLGIVDVYYGDQQRIPRTPAVCVEPGGKTRELNGLPRRTAIRLTVYLIIYHYQLTGPEAIRENNDELAEDIEDFLHLDAQFRVGGDMTVISSLVTAVESGYQQNRNSLFRASRLTLEADSQEQLPMNTP